MLTSCREHYDALINEQNDPVYDPPVLQDYMSQWDGSAFLSKLGLNGTQTVLEIGVGTGRLALKTAPECAVFHGIDISEKTVQRGRENLQGHRNVTIFYGDFLTHRFEDTYDVIYSSLTFMHISDKQAAMQKIAGLLNHKGCFVLSICKNQDSVLDMGVRQIALYPDNPTEILSLALEAALIPEETAETKYAYILAFIKP